MRLNARSLAGYAALGLPMAMAMLPIYMISPKFYGDTLGMDLAALGAILFLTRLLDTVQDPLLGRLVDYLQQKKAGWILLILSATVFLAMGFFMLFVPPHWEGGRLIVWLTISLIVVYTAHSVINVCYLTWGARLTDDVTGRSRVTAWREAFGLIGVVVASVLPTIWVADLGAREGYRIFAWLFVLILVAGLALTLVYSPRPQIAADKSLEGWRHALAPSAVRRVLWFYLFNAIAVALPATLVLFFIDDVVQAPAQAGWFLGVYFFAGMLTLPLWVALSDRIGKARAWLSGSCLAVLALLFSALVGPGDVVTYAVICLAAGAALGADVALPPAMLADAIPRAHRQSTGLYFGIWVLIGKFALALAAGMVLPSLKAFGYQPGLPETTGSLVFLYVLLPILFKLFATLALLPRIGPRFFSKVFFRSGATS